MTDEDDAGNVFAIPDFWRASKLLDNGIPEASRRFFTYNIDDLPTVFQLQPIETKTLIAIPALDQNNDDDPVPVVETLLSEVEKVPEVQSTRQDVGNDRYEDIWLDLKKPPRRAPEHKTWDAFDTPGAERKLPMFITEAGPGAFDSLLEVEGDPLRLQSNDHATVDAEAYCSALMSLALGRESVFFVWQAESRSFKPLLAKIRISGYSALVLEGVSSACRDCGNGSRELRAFVDDTYAKNPSPCRVALASALDRILLVIQSHLSVTGQKPRSLLQLQFLIRRVSSILLYFKSLISKIRRDHLDEDVLTLVFQQAQAAEYSDSHLGAIMREVLQSVGRPWLEFLGEWIGTYAELGVPLSKHDAGRQKGFIKVEAESYVDDFGDEVKELDFRLDLARMPSFMPKDVVQSLFETGRNLRFIKSNHSSHPLLSATAASIEAPPIKWHFDWQSIYQLDRAVRSYEDALIHAIKIQSRSRTVRDDAVTTMPTSNVGGYQLQMFSTNEEELRSRLLDSMDNLAQLQKAVPAEDPLATVLKACLAAKEPGTKDTLGLEFTPHWSLLPVLSFGPIIATQARIIGKESLKLLFNAHNLRAHLKVQRDFHLCRGGSFCSRLSHALFDPDMETAEREAGVARQGGVMGLRLSGRDTWPPASSELRLALMGILVESYEPLGAVPTRRAAESADLPGDLSFGVRDLSSEEIEKCMDPDGLEALDFLRLAYKTPAALTPVITPVILVQYDRIFKSLLRILRMLYTVDRLFRDITMRESGWENPDDISTRFCFEARHFIFTVSSYFFDVGIELPWQDFEEKLDRVEAQLSRQEEDTTDTVLSPDRLREHHSRVLERILSALLLRKRQQPVAKLLDDIFRTILRFAKYARLQARGTWAVADNSRAVSLYQTFRKNVEVFLTVCRGMAEKDANRRRQTARGTTVEEVTGDGVTEESPIAQLLLKLDMFDYYSKT
ncbi:uncharacterized protein VDAG_00369 [Verticillium dahliae VdLs.17]|uniref:Spindle pole body component n=1 Tax=Verticillium dahliae (strain VdLs.17 / ATCC MYA-4575 / FGSC 10137) TaxID=498257 RepID=G2WS36_VERDV|nr:uncharacterized protein VDAG_00369 [Verticillium dahliae VdLs.17]EGY13687.1 hypothetical protein VDAG_00369 [Verticillium dahliae VdLs.17]KAF3350496.1 Serine-threonine kinase receptor-associated protein [Verticillium dahliae VDG2]KAH6710147.1 Spc98 family-domain-containing protein [Verticillium dahliae]PNH41645.1 hypothetical protein VD0003_g9937 [Verticillium dahliae]